MTLQGQHIALAQAYDGITRVIGDLDDFDLQRPKIGRAHV